MRLDVRYEVDTLALMKELVVAGAAHTVLALPAARAEIESGQLLARRICKPALATRLMLAKAVQRPLTRPVRVIEREMKELLRRIVLEAAADLGVRLA